MTAYYNEHDPFAAAWLRELIKAGHIAPGEVDERSIEDVIPSELAGFTQCHFFAGIGVWSYALRCAGWPDDRPVWTGSCPCQPFSAAGKGAGFADERHLWPAFHHLIESCRPITVFGEQVASKDGLAWLDLVAADLEGANYSFGAVDTCAAGFGAPHIRQRLYWASSLVNTTGGGCQQRIVGREATAQRQTLGGREERNERRWWNDASDAGTASWVADAADLGASEIGLQRIGQQRLHPKGGCGLRDEGNSEWTAQGSGLAELPGPVNGFWRNADWLLCRDGKWRPVEPAFKQMADGVAFVMGYLRDYGTDEKVKEAIDAAASHPYTAEVLREVRDGASTEKIWLKVGGQVGFFAATVLLSFVLQREGKLGHFIYCAEKGSAEECAGLLRGLRGGREDARSPLGPEHPQQFRQQLENAMPSLPQISTLEVLGSMNGSPLAHGAPARVGRLRGYGNAIVAQQAQTFIEEYMGIMK